MTSMQEKLSMNIVVLDRYALNPGDDLRDPLAVPTERAVHDRTPPDAAPIDVIRPAAENLRAFLDGGLRNAVNGPPAG